MDIGDQQIQGDDCKDLKTADESPHIVTNPESTGLQIANEGQGRAHGDVPAIAHLVLRWIRI